MKTTEAKHITLLMLQLPPDRLRNEIYALLMCGEYDAKGMIKELQEELGFKHYE